MDYDSIWVCDQCHFTLKSSQVEVIEELVGKQIEKEPDQNNDVNRVDFYEALLEQFKNTLHGNHYMMMKVKSYLISQYGNVPGYFYRQMSHDLVSTIFLFINTINLIKEGQGSYQESSIFSILKRLLLYVIFGSDTHSGNCRNLHCCN